MSASLEARYDIWDDNAGVRRVVGPDHDGLSLVEIQTMNPDGKEDTRARMVLTQSEATLLIVALQRTLADLTQTGYSVVNPPVYSPVTLPTKNQ